MMTLDYQPDFSRLRKTLLLEETDRVPLYDHVGKAVMSGWLKTPVNNFEKTAEFYMKAGYDYVPLSVDLWSTLRQGVSGAAGGESQKGQYSAYEDAPTERVWAEEGKGMISTQEEFEKFDWPGIDDMDFSGFEKAEKLLPENMKVLASAGHILTMVWNLIGMETFCMALVDNPELIERIFKKVGDTQYAVLDRVTKFKVVGAVGMEDDIAYTPGLMLSPKYLRHYLLPWYERMCATCRERGIVTIFHSDGNVTAMIDDIIATGFNGLHPFQPNAMDIREVKEKYGKRICLMGNIDLDVLVRGTPEQVIELTKKNLREIAAPDGGYCAGSSNSIPDFVGLTNFNAMIETVHKYGKFPITI